jgi:hypothetical protein
MPHPTTRSARRAIAIGLAALPLILASPLSAQPAPWTFTEERRAGPPQLEFGSISDVALDAAGRLWIMDGMSGELHVIEAGRRRLIASAGRGPGELQPGAVELVVLPGDTVLVVEPHTLRWHRFDPDGSYASTVTITGETGMTSGWRILPDGRLAARLLPATVVLPDSPPSSGDDPVRAFDASGVAGETLAELPPTESFRMGSGPMPIITLLAPQPLWAVDERGRVLVASTHAYAVRATAGEGGTTTVVESTAQGGRIGADLAAAARELLREEFAQRRTPPPVLDRLVADAHIAETAPVIGGLMAGPEGTIWIREAARTGDELVDIQQPGGRTWRVHDAQGRLVGMALMPGGFQPVEWRGDRLVGIGRDDLGQTYALVLRVMPRR